jgi:predicted TIM-barrel fold metal-dependent hydrolase
VHIEFAAVAKDSASRHQLYRKELGKMVEANPETPFVLIHMGQLSEKEAGEMLGKFKNLYLMTSHADPFTTEHSSQPWVNMYSNQSLTPAWQGLMKQYPDRFVFALDNVWADHWQHEYPKKVNLWRKALGELPPDVAKAVAHGNAERLWGLK